VYRTKNKYQGEIDDGLESGRTEKAARGMP
jgi:hypothetical protein